MNRRALETWLPAWVGALATLGMLAAHELAYLILSPDPHARAQLLHDTGHRDWHLAGALALGAIVAGCVTLVRRGLGDPRRPARAARPFRYAVPRLMALQCTSFALLETTERLSTTHAWHANEFAILAVGLILQIAISLLVGVLLSGIDGLIQKFRRQRPLRGVREAPPIVALTWHPRAHRRPARGEGTLRGPPRLATPLGLL